MLRVVNIKDMLKLVLEKLLDSFPVLATVLGLAHARKSEEMEQIYLASVERTLLFDQQYPEFFNQLERYIENFRIFRDYLNREVNTFKSDRGTSIIKPYLFTVDVDQVLVCVLSRGYMMDGSLRNNTHYVKARYMDAQWTFAKIQGFVRMHHFKSEEFDVVSDKDYLGKVIWELIHSGYYLGTSPLLSRLYLSKKKL